ncbi:MAG: glycogen synthase GlgA [Verrucomicrobia bacterium]|nr:MAG: glycogen synthase GlgA [Verrucomicrobiota bacterium]
MRILIASSELFPYSKTGGLADMTAALAKYLARAGHEVHVFTPWYRCVREAFPETADLPAAGAVEIDIGGSPLIATVHRLDLGKRLAVWFVRHDPFFDREGLYDVHTPTGRAAYPDNFARFVFFSRAVVEAMRRLELAPAIVHAHDWQTGLIPLLIRHRGWYEFWEQVPRTVFTIHNLVFQGRAAAHQFALTGLPAYYFHHQACEFYGDVNLLKTGIVFADAVTTVSPRYAREITTPEFGAGLDGVLRARRRALSGILNGIDEDVWQTRANPHLPAAYDAGHLEGKAVCKAALQREMELPEAPQTPLFGTISRLEHQKGIDLILQAWELLADEPWQYVLLGSGDPRLEELARVAQQRWPDRFRFVQGRDEGLAHRIEAGADFYLMPSRYEPCGLNQMYSLRYGTVPIVHAVGGLDDAVVDEEDDPERATGIKFREPTAAALAAAIRRALELYAQPETLVAFRRRGMQADVGWRRAAREYVALYRRLLR